MSSLLFYKNIVALDADAHRQLKIRPIGGYRFAAEATAIPIVVGEFADVARQNPIAFLRAGDGNIMPVALVGLPEGVNLYLGADGNWTAPYVPAFVRRYPFVFAESGPDRLTLCIDRDHEGFSDSEGQALFEADGQPGSVVNDAVGLLTKFQRQHALTRQFVKRLEEAGLLMEATANASLPDGSSFTLQGLLVVDEKKFRGIPDALLKEWFVSGEIGLVYAHMISLGMLLELLRRRPAPAAKRKSRKR